MVTLPPLQFVDTNAEACRNAVITGFEAATGRTLYPGNPERLFLEGLAYVVTVLLGQVDFACKQNLVTFAQGAHLDHLGAESATPRLSHLPATTILRFAVAEALSFPVEIPQDTRVSTADHKIVFQTDTVAFIAPSKTYVDIPATAMQAGSAANGLVPGQVNCLVDTPAYVFSASNLTLTGEGADNEEDTSYRTRILLAREAYTCAGPRGMYEYLVKQVHKDIAEAGIYTPEPGTVAVCPVMRGGILPSVTIIEAIKNVLNAEDVRPLTDTVLVHVPEVVPYSINLRWYLDKKDAALSGTIENTVRTAASAYVEWQHGKPGRDINPDELLARLKQAGIKRVEMESPHFQRLEPFQLARLETIDIVFAGLEDA